MGSVQRQVPITSFIAFSGQNFPWTGLPVIEEAVRHMLIPFIVLAVGIFSPPPGMVREKPSCTSSKRMQVYAADTGMA